MGQEFSAARPNSRTTRGRSKHFPSSVVLPGIAITTGPMDYRAIEQMRLVQFDGYTWQPIGEVIESAFVGTMGQHRPN